jgi:hypothetical protein
MLLGVGPDYHHSLLPSVQSAMELEKPSTKIISVVFIAESIRTYANVVADIDMRKQYEEYTEVGQTTTGYAVFSQTTSTALAQSAIRKLSVRSISPMDTYELSDVERKMIIWALQELVRLYGWHDV